MKRHIIMMALAIASVATAQAKNETDTLNITTTPQMHCEGCENKIKREIRFVKGVKDIKTSVEEQRVTIIYNKAKATYEDFVKAFGKIGYTISRHQAYECMPERK